MNNRILTSRLCPSLDDWNALLAGDLATGRIEEMEAHLDGCPACVVQLETLAPPLGDELCEAIRVPISATPALAGHHAAWSSAARPEPVDGPLIFERKGRYRSLGLVEFGGMGEVYRVWEIGLERTVAVKIPSSNRLSPKLIKRFLNEAPRQAQLEHPNIVRIYASDEQDGIPYFAMEFVEGETLCRAGRRSRFAPRHVAEVVRQIALAVDYAHSKGVFHRDLKPANIMLATSGVPKILDFGLARILDEPSGAGRSKGAGTAEYMAPEQWEEEPESSGDRLDLYRRTDVYGLGAILYELLAGRPPFLPDQSRNEIRRQVRFEAPQQPRTLRPEIPHDLEAICMRCLCKRPEDRYATAHELANDLGRFLAGFPLVGSSLPKRLGYFLRRHRRIVAAACVALVALTTAVGLYGSAHWNYQRAIAAVAFDEGREKFKNGRITDGLKQMRTASDALPFGETVLRGYFQRNLQSLEQSLSREMDSQSFPRTIRSAVVSADPNERYVLVGDAEGKTIFWDRGEGRTHVLPTPAGRPIVSAVAINRPGTLCASADTSGGVIVWALPSCVLRWAAKLDDRVDRLTFLGDSGRLLAGTLSNEGPALRIVNTDVERDASPRPFGVEGPGSGGQWIVSPAGDRCLFVPLVTPGRCQLWDLKNDCLVRELQVDSDGAAATSSSPRLRAAFSADGNLLVVAGARLTVYDARGGAILRSGDAGSWRRVLAVTVRDNGSVILALVVSNASVIRHVTSDLGVWVDFFLERDASLGEQVAFTSQGRILAGISTRRLRILFPPPMVFPHARIDVPIGQVQVGVTGDGSRVASLTGVAPPATRPRTEKEKRDAISSVLHVWEGDSLRLISRVNQFPKGSVAVSLACGPRADALALGCLSLDDRDSAVLLAQPMPGGNLEFRQLGSHQLPVTALAFDADGSRLFTGSGSVPGKGLAELKCWDVGSHSGLLWETRFPTTIDAIAVSPDGRRIVVGGRDGRLVLMASDDSRVLAEIPVGSEVVALAYAHSSPLLAVTQSTDHVRLFRISDDAFEPYGQFDEPGSAFSSVAFGRDDLTLYVRGAGGVARRDVATLRGLDPTIQFGEALGAFCVISRPEAVVAVTRGGRLVQWPIQYPEPVP